MLGEELAGDGAFLDLGPALGDGLSHLPGHAEGEGVAVLAQLDRQPAQEGGALGERGSAPMGKGPGGGFEAGADRGVGVLRMDREEVAGGGVDGAQRLHGRR